MYRKLIEQRYKALALNMLMVSRFVNFQVVFLDLKNRFNLLALEL